MRFKSLSLLIIFFLAVTEYSHSKNLETVVNHLDRSKIEAESASNQWRLKDEDKITASDYSEFLNAIEACDLDGFYDEKMAAGLENLCIIRIGSCGYYTYEVISGRGETPVSFINQVAAAQYCLWKGIPQQLLQKVKNIDPALKSNLLTFSLVNSDDALCQAGEPEAIAAASDVIDEILFLTFFVVGLEGRENSTSSASSIFKEPAFLQEKEQVAQLLQERIITSNKEEDWRPYYRDADAIWLEEQQAWKERTSAQRELDSKTILLEHAKILLANVTQVRVTLDKEKTLLGRIARYSEKAAIPLSFIPGPVPFGGVANTVSGVASGFNEIWVNKDILLAERAVARSEREMEQAIQKAKTANDQVAALRIKAQGVEEQARLLERTVERDSIERIHPPVTSLYEADWIEWATHIVCEGKGAPNEIIDLANHGMTDPLWTREIVSTALKKRALEDFQAVEEQKRLTSFEKTFQETSQTFQKALETTGTAQKEASKAEQRLESATQIYHHWKRELEQNNEMLNELEKPENVRRPGNADQIRITKEKFCAALTEFEQACNDIKIHEATLAKARHELTIHEATTAQLRDEVTVAEEIFSRNKERAKLRQERTITPQLTLRLPRWNEEGALKREQLEKSVFLFPEILTKAYETIGRALHKKQQRMYGIETPRQSVARLIPEIKVPTKEDLARWKASHQAEDFIEERDNLISTIKERCGSLPSKTVSKVAAGLGTIAEEEQHDDEGSEAVGKNERAILSSLTTSTKNVRKNRTASGSITSIRSESNQSKSSIGSFVSSSSLHSWTGSIAESLSASVASAASNKEMKALKKATQAINKAAMQWAQLVRKADAERIAAGGELYPDEETLFEAWQKADLLAEATWEKRCHLQEEAVRTAAMAHDWEMSTLRWEARAKTDRLTREIKETELDLVSLAAIQKPLDFAWNAHFKSVSDHLDQIKKAAKTAEEAWSTLAELNASPKEKLREEDQAVNALWEQVYEEYYQEKEPESRRAQKTRLGQETGAYKFDLITEKNNTVATCFAEINAASELTAQERYAECTLGEALKAAREKIPGAEAAWEFRVAKAIKDQQVVQQTEDLKSQERLAAIAAADQAALEAFKKEATRLASIEAVWKAQLEAEEKIALIKRIAAANNVHQGNPIAWDFLPHYEKEAYNEAVSAANEEILDQIQHRFQETVETALELGQRAKKVWFSKRTAEQRAEKAKAELMQLKMNEDERRVAIRRAKMLEFDYKTEQEENLFQITNGNLQEEENHFLPSLLKLRSNIADRAWKEAQEFSHDLEISWVRKAGVVQAGYHQAIYYIKQVQEGFGQHADTKRALLAQLPGEAQELLVAATLDLIKAEEEKEAWNEKLRQAEEYAHTALDPKVFKAKTVFEEVRNAWEGLRLSANIENAQGAQLMADRIKDQVVLLSNGDLHPQAYTALTTMSSSAEALADLILTARNHSRMRTAAATGTGSFGLATTGTAIAFSNASVATAAISVMGIVAYTAGMAAIPITIGGAAYYGYKYYKKRRNPTAPMLGALAPRTTQTALTALHLAQEITKRAAHKTINTLWTADTAWCRDALREVEKLVRVITGALPATEAEVDL